MLPADDLLKLGFRHPHWIVRDEVRRYFADSFSTDATIIPLAVEMIRENGFGLSFSDYWFFHQLPWTDPDSWKWVARRIAKLARFDYSFSESLLCTDTIVALARADIDIVRAGKAELTELAQYESEGLEIAQRRVSLAATPADELWRMWGELPSWFSRPGSSIATFTASLALVEALVNCGDRFAQPLLAVCQSATERTPDWLRALSTRAIGRYGLREAVPTLLTRLTRGSRREYDEVTEALVRMTDDDIVHQCVALGLSGGSQHTQVEIATLLGKMHHEQAIECGLQWLARERAKPLELPLAVSIAGQLSLESLEPLRATARRLTHHPDVTDLRMRLIAIGLLNDVSFPERDQWQEELSTTTISMQDWVCDIEESYATRGQDAKARVRADSADDDDDDEFDDDSGDDGDR